MLLNRMRPRRAHSHDEGAALPAVLGFMTVSVLLVTLISTTVVSGMGQATSTRAGVQSQAAAEAGIAAARALVDAGSCPASAVVDNSAVAATPRYKVQIAQRTGMTGAWTNGCPGTNKRGQVRYTATGWAASTAVAGQSANNKAYVEAIYGAMSATATTGTGAAIYAYGTTGTSGLGAGVGLLNTLTLPGSPRATIQVLHGDANCSGAALNTSADWIVADGSFTQNGLCLAINGNVAASGLVDMNSLLSTIKGNVSAGSFHMSSTSHLIGSAWVRGASSFDNDLFRPTIDAKLNTRTATGNVTVGGTKTVSGTDPGPSPYTMPVVPGWVDYNFTGASGWPGYTVKTLPVTSCNAVGVSAALASFGTAPGVIDAQACTNGTFLTGLSISNLPNDIAIIVPNNQNVTIGGLALTTGSHNIAIVQPDDVPNGAPDCPAGGALTMAGVNISSPHLMIYTPCTYIENAGLIGVVTFTGQIYAGKASLGNGLASARVQNFAAVGLPGVDLTAGTYTADGPRGLIAQRNVLTGP